MSLQLLHHILGDGVFAASVHQKVPQPGSWFSNIMQWTLQNVLTNTLIFTVSSENIILEVGYRGLFFGHSFRSSWTPDKLVTWYLLIPFSKKKLKKVRKPGCPLRKMEESKMAAAMCQNWHFQPLRHFFEYFSLVKTCYFMFLMPRDPFLKDLLIFYFPFLRKGQFCSKFKRRRFSMISRILKLICC